MFHYNTLPDLDIAPPEDVRSLCSCVRHHKQFLVVYSKYAGYGKTFYIQNYIATNQALNDAIYVCLPVQQATGSIVGRLKDIYERYKHEKVVIHLDIGYLLDHDTNYLFWSLIMFGKIVDETSAHVFQLKPTMTFIFEVPSKVETKADPLHHFYALRLLQQHQVKMDAESVVLETFQSLPQSGKKLPPRTHNLDLMTVCTFLSYFERSAINNYIQDKAWDHTKHIKADKQTLFRLLLDALKSNEVKKPTWILFNGLINFMGPHITAFVQWPFFFNLSIPPPGWSYEFSRIFLQTSATTVNRNLQWMKNGSESSLTAWEDRNNITLLMLFSYEHRYEDGILVSRPTSFSGVNLLSTRSLGEFIKDAKVRNFLSDQGISMDKQQLYLPNSEMADIEKCIEHLFSLTPMNDRVVKRTRTDFIKTGLQNGTINYILTPDNFLKMVFIQYRLRYHLPVIMMAETGIGKTALINFMVEKMLGCTLYQLDVHAGTTHKDVVEFVGQAIAEFKRGTQVYLFFDEFNTTEDTAAICLFKEIFCDRRVEGVSLHEGFNIIGAVNPYRFKDVPQSEGLSSYKANLNLNKKEQVYRVKPLPNSIHEHIFNFGTLDKTTERLYISQMCHQYVSKIGELKAINNLKLLEGDMTSLVLNSHIFLRQDGHSSDGPSAVSLRDVKRYFQLFQWFLEISLDNKQPPIQLKIRRAILLSLFITYNCRLDRKLRKEHWRHVLQHSLNHSEYIHGITVDDIEAILKESQNNLAQQFTLTTEDNPGKVALNESFVENLFVAFVCILNKIALYIVGKPGTSKSLAITVLMNNLEATTENQSRLKKWKIGGIRYFFYQCSEQSTEEAVKQAFDKAKLFDRSNEVGEAR